ncbi:MAG: zf-HC2 domain-containing protein [Acidobacteria bacterium]|nr:zf-HC2 domain-containing protein [Acidobacteriota bacterium]MCA1637268.1 zf-HC2 domain-containing protein [Acidobacteriota bacterium]
MTYENEKLINCSNFEELLTDYLDGNLDRRLKVAMAEHALSCPLCHALLNEVKDALQLCHEISVPKTSFVKLEARILSMTTPETAMVCNDFEEHLTDYLDGFLPAPVFHRWERHAVLCEKCTDLPGEVVRSIAACYTYKLEELPIPAGLNAKILQATLGMEKRQTVKPSRTAQTIEWIRGLSFPISIPQFAPVAMIMLFAVLIFSQTVSADGSISGMYQKSFELAGQTYQQGASVVLGEKNIEQKSNQEPVSGTFVNNEENR